jgi:hypothetical protein
VRALPEGGARSYLAGADAMQETAETNPLQLLFIELRVGLARSAIQAALLLNGGAIVALLLFLASLMSTPAPGALAVNLVRIRPPGLVHRWHDLRECLCGARSDRIRPLKRIRQHHATIGLKPDRYLPSSLPCRDCPCGSRDLT